MPARDQRQLIVRAHTGPPAVDHILTEITAGCVVADRVVVTDLVEDNMTGLEVWRVDQPTGHDVRGDLGVLVPGGRAVRLPGVGQRQDSMRLTLNRVSLLRRDIVAEYGSDQVVDLDEVAGRVQLRQCVPTQIADRATQRDIVAQQGLQFCAQLRAATAGQERNSDGLRAEKCAQLQQVSGVG
jgi:hypothetical protein